VIEWFGQMGVVNSVSLTGQHESGDKGLEGVKSLWLGFGMEVKDVGMFDEIRASLIDEIAHRTCRHP
jgi:hypothetical protein